MSHSDKGAAHQWPVTTLAVFAVTAAVTASQLRIPSLVPALQRLPNEIAHREYWRLITSLLVHDEGWRQVVFNLIMLIVAGTWAERIFRGREWLLLYLSAGILGQVAGLYWQPRGAGNSVAVCGLVGRRGLLDVAVNTPAIPLRRRSPSVWRSFADLPSRYSRPAALPRSSDSSTDPVSPNEV